MVQTRSAAKTIESGQAHTNGTTVDNPPGNESLPPAKTRRPQGVAALKKRQRRKPGELCQLNLDVLFLIAAYMHPLDILNLARTCKSLRVLLMDKSSAFIWRHARCQVKCLPDCPADLTEPEYANLVFYARCHGCGKHTRTVFWEMRRRYCPDCRVERLCSLRSCPEIIRTNNLMAVEHLTVGQETESWVDKEQMESFMDSYNRSSDKEQLLRDRQRQFTAICLHARKCQEWRWVMAAEHQDVLEMRRQERAANIFERLKQHGYGPEVVHFGRHDIQNTRKSLFRTSKRLTDKEWNRIWPEWLGTMNALRARRVESVVYRPRRLALVSEFATYLTSPSPNAPAFDLLPHVADIARFPPFRDIIRAPEGVQANSELFEPAFAQLPALVDEWRKKLDAELRELIQIPARLSRQDTSGVASSSTTMHTESSRTATDKLRLACALFHCRDTDGIFTYHEMFLVAMRHHAYPSHSSSDDLEHVGPIHARFDIKYVEEAPYIVYLCGLDPNVATIEDMDHRNARIKCFSCLSQCIWRWKDAVYHVRLCHPIGRALQLPRLQVVGDEHMNAIQAIELLVKKELTVRWTRCLLCRPHVGGAVSPQMIMKHLESCHHIEAGDVKRGVHWVSLGIHEVHLVEMIEEGGQVTFRPCAFR